MIKIVFTASIVKIDKGCYAARSDELSVTSGRASTQRGAIKQLKSAVLIRLRKAAETGKLAEILDDAGYFGDRVDSKDATMSSFAFNNDTVSVQLPRQFSALNRTRREETGEERNNNAIE
jgi:hypothetical protein